jgi:8-amino-7-oxononanoate synthase
VIADEPERRTQLLERAQLLRELLIEGGVPAQPGSSQIIPVILGDNARTVAVAAAMQQAGFDVRAIRPPSVPPDTARLRISVNTNLDESTLRRFAETLITALTEIRLCSAASL